MNSLRNRINQDYLANESEMIKRLLDSLGAAYDSEEIQQQAYAFVSAIRKEKDQQTLVEAFLHEYQLNSEEGIALMEIAEALLRIPDHHTQHLFLQEKLSKADWHKHRQHSDSLLVNFVTRALALSGKIEQHSKAGETEHSAVFPNLSSITVPLINTALHQAMQQLAYQFVMAETIDNALAKAHRQSTYLYSFDMLGEAALTASDADRYFNAYSLAIKSLSRQAGNNQRYDPPAISIKLSALRPRYEPLQHKQAVQQISSKLLYLAKKARAGNVSVTIDAEETERLEMSLDIFKNVISDLSLQGWGGLGLAVQAYQKRAFSTLQWLASLAKSLQCKIPVRLVKGAYWDSEIKRAQVNGLANYPVYTSKAATDICYLACSQLMLAHPEQIYPQFATHNAHTVAAILQLGRNHPGYEFQRLHGMGEQLYQQVLKQTGGIIPCRVYAPVGNYQGLLPYLVRRLLENGANTSFINQLENPEISIENVIADPINGQKKSNACIRLPRELYGKQRINSNGVNLADPEIIAQLDQQLLRQQTWLAAPLINGLSLSGAKHECYNPTNNREIVGHIIYSDEEAINNIIQSASSAYKDWRLTAVRLRASYLQNAADLLEQNRIELLSLCVREAGKTIQDALAEIREAIDFCRYYAQSAIELFEQPIDLSGSTGEKNQLYQYGRGVFVCISPWNFPIAIFIGQVVAALVSGNSVIAKPATQTSLMAMRCVQLLHQAGFPKQVLQFLPGDGASIGQYLLSDHRISGVAFTGSLSTAKLINQQLSKHQDIIPLIAETGGQNVMIADSSAHTEQAVQDVVRSAFNSAGQRCSALRVLFIPEVIGDEFISRIIGVMQQLIIGDPQHYETDIGPLISQNAVQQLTAHIAKMRKQAQILFQATLPTNIASSYFFPPTLVELTSLSQLTEENFGPVLHIIRYQPTELDQLIEIINESGYGLTLGVHSRINSTIDKIVKNCKVGNIYVNRNMISAVVGVQPFGGVGLSGTGPKAGGPHYLQRFAYEQTVSTNTAAIGGNASLLTAKLN